MLPKTSRIQPKGTGRLAEAWKLFKQAAKGDQGACRELEYRRSVKAYKPVPPKGVDFKTVHRITVVRMVNTVTAHNGEWLLCREAISMVETFAPYMVLLAFSDKEGDLLASRHYPAEALKIIVDMREGAA